MGYITKIHMPEVSHTFQVYKKII